MVEAMKLFASDDTLRNQYRTKGLAQAKKFNWDETAKKMMDIYKSLG
jgi:glycosyltransferase involved in cell wall biosynthesis